MRLDERGNSVEDRAKGSAEVDHAGARGAVADPRADGVSLRCYRDGDEEGLLRLLTETFGRWPAVDVAVEPVEHLRWKLSSHEAASGLHFVAECESAIVGSRLTLVQRMKVKDRVLLRRQGVDLAVHPAYRGLGIMAKLQEFRRDEVAQICDFQLDGQSPHPALIKLAERHPHVRFGNEVEVFERPLALLSLFSALRRAGATGTTVRSAALACYHLARERLASQRHVSWTIREVDRFDDRFDSFWQEASQAFDFIAVRDSDYLNWRYADRRAGAFVIKAAEEDGRVLGFTALRVLRGKGYLADLLALPGRDDVARSLVRDALARFRAAGVSAVQWWSPTHHPYKRILTRHGFFHKRKRKRELAYRVLRATREELAFLEDPRAAVHFVLGDTDVV